MAQDHYYTYKLTIGTDPEIFLPVAQKGVVRNFLGTTALIFLENLPISTLNNFMYKMFFVIQKISFIIRQTEL